MQVSTVDGSPLRVGGFVHETLNLGGRRFPFLFLRANVQRAILGLDFLEQHAFTIDPVNKLLRSLVSSHTVRAVSAPMNPQCWQIRHQPEYESLLSEFPTLTKPNFSAPTMPHNVFCHIPTHGHPVKEKARRLSGDKLAAAKAEFEKMEQAGIVRRSTTSGWAAPLHLVRKPDRSWRPCVDYRRLNAITEEDAYAMPNMHDFSRHLAGKKIFSKVDLAKGYYQIPVHPDDVDKTATATPFGTWVFLRMPFGLKNACAAFQRLMDVVCDGLVDVYVYLDDIIVASSTPEEHLAALRALFTRLEQHGLVIHPAKCVFGQESVEFLGHSVSRHGIRPLEHRVQALTNSPPPSTVKELQSFLGAINFYRAFLPGLAGILAPLHTATAGKRGSEKVHWDASCKQAFVEAKTALSNAVMLKPPNWDARFSLKTDASDKAIGAVLEQVEDGHLRPVSFFSRKLSGPELNYSTYDRELLAAFEAVKHFRHYLEGRQFDLFTDHKPLLGSLGKKAEIVCQRQQRQLSYLSGFHVRLHHVSGQDNVVADFLSRPPEPEPVAEPDSESSCPDPILDPPDVVCAVQVNEELAEQQEADASLKQLLAEDKHEWKRVQGCWFAASTSPARLAVPEQHRRAVFDDIHGLSHPGVRATKRLVSSRYIWPGLNKQVTAWAKACPACQRSKVQVHTKPEVKQFHATNARFETVHIDIVGPLPQDHGYKYLLTCIDRFSRWVEAVPLQNITAQLVSKKFIEFWVARYGVPKLLIADNGTQFTSTEFKNLASLIGCQIQHTTPYHPEGNGLLERWHRTLKHSLMARLEGHTNWTEHLPWAMLGLRSTLVAGSQHSPAEILFGQTLTLPGPTIPAQDSKECRTDFPALLRSVLPASMPAAAHHSNSTHATPQLIDRIRSASHVFLRQENRTSLVAPYTGPHRLIRVNRHTATLDVNGKTTTVTLARLKPATVLPPTTSTDRQSGLGGAV